MVDDYLLRANGIVENLRKLRQQNNTQKKLFDVEDNIFDNRIGHILGTINKNSLKRDSNYMIRKVDMLMGANEVFDLCTKLCVLICKGAPASITFGVGEALEGVNSGQNGDTFFLFLSSYYASDDLLHTICLKAILDRREGEKIVELKNEELAALRIQLVDFMQKKGPLRKDLDLLTKSAGQLQNQKDKGECSVDDSQSDVGQQGGQMMNNDNFLSGSENGGRCTDKDKSDSGDCITEIWYDLQCQNGQYHDDHSDSHRSRRSSGGNNKESDDAGADTDNNNTNTSNEYSVKDKDYYIFSSPINPQYGSTFKTPRSNPIGTGTIFRGSEPPIIVSHTASKNITGSRPHALTGRIQVNSRDSTKISKIHHVHHEGDMTAKDIFEQNLLWLYNFRRDVQKCFPMKKDSEMLIKDSLKVVRALFSTSSGHRGISKGLSHKSTLKASNSSSREICDFFSATPSPKTISRSLSRSSHAPVSMSSRRQNNAPHLCPSLTRTRRLVLSDGDSCNGSLHYTSTLEDRLYLLAERKYGLRVMAVQYVASFLATVERCAVLDAVTGEGATGDEFTALSSSSRKGDMKHCSDRGQALIRNKRHLETESAKGTCEDTIEIDKVELLIFLATYRNEVGDDYHLQQSHLVLSINRLVSEMCRAGIVTQPSCRILSPVSLLTFPESLREYVTDDRPVTYLKDEPQCQADATVTFSSISLSVGMWMEGVVKNLFDKGGCSIIESELNLISNKIADSYILQTKSSREAVGQDDDAGNLRRISYQQLVSYIQRYHLAVQRESLLSFKILFQQCDSDGDGLLSPSEMWLCATDLKNMEKQEEQKRIAVEADSKLRAVVNVKRNLNDTMERRGSAKAISSSPIGAVSERSIPGRRRDSGRHTTKTVSVNSKKELLPDSTVIPSSTPSNHSSCENESDEKEEEDEEAFYSTLRHAVPTRNNFQDSKFSFTTAKYFFKK